MQEETMITFDLAILLGFGFNLIGYVVWMFIRPNIIKEGGT
jgi:hypothetical protein